MVTRAVYLVLLLSLSHIHGFVLRKRASERGANRLAEALRAIQMEKRRLSEHEATDNGYYGNPYGWHLGDQESYGGLSDLDEYMNGREGNEFYNDYDKLSPDDMRLLEYYYDLGSRSDEPESGSNNNIVYN